MILDSRLLILIEIKNYSDILLVSKFAIYPVNDQYIRYPMIYFSPERFEINKIKQIISKE